MIFNGCKVWASCNFASLQRCGSFVMFENPAIYFLPTRDMLLYVETTRLSTMWFYIFPNQIRCFLYICSGSKASLSIMQFHFPSNIVPATSGVWAPCNFTFFQAFKTLNVGYNLFKILEIYQLFEYHAILLPYKTAALWFSDVWVPCNFTPFQTLKDLTI